MVKEELQMPHSQDQEKSKKRKWTLEDLKSNSPNIDAVPCIFLEKWRTERVNYMTTEELASVIQDRLGTPLKSRGSARLISFFRERQRKRGLEPLFRPERIYDPKRRRVVKRWSWDPSKYEDLFERFERKYSPFREKTPVEIALEKVETEITKLLDQVASLEKDKNALREQLAILTKTGVIIDQQLKQRCADLLDGPSVQLDTVIREAGAILEDRLRSLAGLDSSYYGKNLVKATLGCDDPRIVFSEMRGAQEGVCYLFRGAIQYIRNPPAHGLIEYDRETAMVHLRLVDALLSLLRLGKQKSR